MKTQVRRWTRWWIAAALACLALVTAGCGGTQGSIAGAGDSPATAPGQQLNDLPAPSPTATPTASASEEPVDQYGLPYDLTGYELLAARAGEAIYSGYACAIAPVGCACETPVIERISFTFAEPGHLSYHFAGDGYQATWEMTRLGANQWGYTQGYIIEGTETVVSHVILLTFTDTGFIRNDGVDFREEGFVSCPDVTFRRLAVPTPEP